MISSTSARSSWHVSGEAAGTATTAGILFNQLVAFLLGQLHVGAGEVVRVALLAGLYNAVLTPILFPVIRRVAESSRAKKVFRW